VRFAVVPRGDTLAYAADLDGDGEAEWVLESQRARAVFSSRDGGRWREFVWKDSGTNVLPESGALASTGATEVEIMPDSSLEFRAAGRRRTVRLTGATLTVDQTGPLPGETLETGKKGDLDFRTTRESSGRAVYRIERRAE
jgi:hypothetical protein